MRERSIENHSSEVEELKNRLAEAEQLIEAIKAGEVDAFTVFRNNKPEVFTLESGDYAYRILVENFSEGALNLSEDGLIVYTNNYFNDLLYLPYEKVIGHSIYEFIHPSSQEAFSNLFKKGLSGQSKGEINLLTKGKIIPVYISLTSLYPTLPTVGMIVSDLTNKKKQESVLAQNNLDLERMNKALKQGEERYQRMITEVADYAIIFLSREGIIENWNTGAQKIKGYKAEEIIGKNFSIFYAKQDKESGLPEKLLKRAREKGTALHEGWRVRKDGSLFWGSTVITALHDEENNIIGFSKVTRDLTDKKLAEDKIKEVNEELRKKNRDLEKMNKELQSFAYISSHDLQEPLRKIQTFATRIIEKELGNLSPYGLDTFGRMQDAAKRMQTLIEDLLLYSRTNSEDRQFETKDLLEIVEEVKEEMKEDLEEKNASVEAHGACKARIIPFQFRQLLHNLIGNSLKFSTPGVPPLIKIEAEVANGKQFKLEKLAPLRNYCHICVSDNGIGFEQQYSEKIFEVFQRLHGRSEYEGTGIGLSIVKKIIENHDGVITAAGELNKGTTFDIYIPAT